MGCRPAPSRSRRLSLTRMQSWISPSLGRLGTSSERPWRLTSPLSRGPDRETAVTCCAFIRDSLIIQPLAADQHANGSLRHLLPWKYCALRTMRPYRRSSRTPAGGPSAPAGLPLKPSSRLDSTRAGGEAPARLFWRTSTSRSLTAGTKRFCSSCSLAIKTIIRRWLPWRSCTCRTGKICEPAKSLL